MNQHPLFQPTGLAAASTGTGTDFGAPRQASLEAARSIRWRIDGDRLRVLECLRAAGARGRTDEEMQEEIPMSPNTQRPRRGELVALGVVVPTTEKRRTRVGGRKAVVWVAK